MRAVTHNTVDDFWQLVDKQGPVSSWSPELGRCWVFPYLNVAGYGRICLNGPRVLTHRLAYELLVGPIPPGLVLDHLCRNRACCNPDHLEAVSLGENIRRGMSAQRTREFFGSRTHCGNGHELTPENVHRELMPNGALARRCRRCQADRQAKYRARKKAARA